MSCCEVVTIRPGGIETVFFDFSQQEPIWLDGLSLTGTPTITFDPITNPDGGSTSPNFAPTLGTPSIVAPSVNPAGAGVVNTTTGQVQSVTLTAGGTGWSPAPAVVWCTFTGGGGWGAVGVCTVSQGAVVSVRMASPGAGYTTNPTAVFHQACISVLVTTNQIQNGYTYTARAFCNLSDGVQNVQAEGQILVSW